MRGFPHHPRLSIKGFTPGFSPQGFITPGFITHPRVFTLRNRGEAAARGEERIFSKGLIILGPSLSFRLLISGKVVHNVRVG